MLVLTRKPGEAVVVGSGVRLKVLRVHGGSVRIGIEAPDDVPVVREELNEWRDGADFRDGAPLAFA